MTQGQVGMVHCLRLRSRKGEHSRGDIRKEELPLGKVAVIGPKALTPTPVRKSGELVEGDMLT